MKYIKTFESFVNENQQVDEGVGVPMLDAIKSVLAVGVAGAAIYVSQVFIGSFVGGLERIGSSIKRIVAPTKIDKFAKIIENDKDFNRDFLNMLETEFKTSRKPWRLVDFSERMIKLPSFQRKWVEFVEENKLSATDAEALLLKIQFIIKDTMMEDGERIIADIKKKFPTENE